MMSPNLDPVPRPIWQQLSNNSLDGFDGFDNINGFSLVELLTVIVIIGVISTALFSMGNYMNMRVERITVQALLDEQAVLAHDAIGRSAAQAGYVAADSLDPAITRTSAVNLVQSNHIQFCGETLDGDRALTEFRLQTTTEGGVLQRKLSETNCLSDSTVAWRDVSEPVFSQINFTHTDSGPEKNMLTLSLRLSKNVRGSRDDASLNRDYKIPLIALLVTP